MSIIESREIKKDMSNTDHGEYGFRYGGIIYHSDSKDALQKKRRELAVNYGNSLSEMEESYPSMRVDTETFKSLSEEYETKRVQ